MERAKLLKIEVLGRSRPNGFLGRSRPIEDGLRANGTDAQKCVRPKELRHKSWERPTVSPRKALRPNLLKAEVLSRSRPKGFLGRSRLMEECLRPNELEGRTLERPNELQMLRAKMERPKLGRKELGRKKLRREVLKSLHVLGRYRPKA